MRRAVWLATPLLPLGCTLDAGGGFARLETVQLSARLEPGAARDLGGALLTDRGYGVRLERLTLQVGALELSELSGGAAGAFDPANPPPGYTSCHGGHCHAEDGRLVDYADVEAELGAGGGFAVVASLPVDRPLDVVPGGEWTLSDVEPSRELPQAELRQVSLEARRVSAAGTVSGGGLAEPVPLTVDLPLSRSLEGPIDIEVSRDGPEVLRPTIDLVLDGTLFDGVDFAALIEAGTIDLVDPESPAAALVMTSLLNSELDLAQ